MTVAPDQDPTREQWGGFAEARAMAHIWNLTLYMVSRSPEGECQLFTQSIRPVPSKGVVCLCYSGGSHFDYLQTSEEALRRLDGPVKAQNQRMR